MQKPLPGTLYTMIVRDRVKVTGFGDHTAKHVHGVVSTESRDIEPQLRTMLNVVFS